MSVVGLYSPALPEFNAVVGLKVENIILGFSVYPLDRGGFP